MDVEIKESEFMAKKGELHLLSSPAIEIYPLSYECEHGSYSIP